MYMNYYWRDFLQLILIQPTSEEVSQNSYTSMGLVSLSNKNFCALIKPLVTSEKVLQDFYTTRIVFTIELEKYIAGIAFFTLFYINFAMGKSLTKLFYFQLI